MTYRARQLYIFGLLGTVGAIGCAFWLYAFIAWGRQPIQGIVAVLCGVFCAAAGSIYFETRRTK